MAETQDTDGPPIVNFGGLSSRLSYGMAPYAAPDTRLRARYRKDCVMGFTATLREDQRLLLAALKNFGTWRRAMEAAGLGHLVGLRPPARRSTLPDTALRRASKSQR